MGFNVAHIKVRRGQEQYISKKFALNANELLV
jgi:hypothetical protein